MVAVATLLVRLNFNLDGLKTCADVYTAEFVHTLRCEFKHTVCRLPWVLS
jgi:hypothetical protein